VGALKSIEINADRTADDLQLHGSSSHCGGGAGFVFSNALLRAMRPRLDDCARTHHTVLFWYWDEVEIARCIWEYLQLECLEPSLGWGVEPLLQAAAAEANQYPLHEMNESLWARRYFMSDLTTDADWERWFAVVGDPPGGRDDKGANLEWAARVGTLTFHKATPLRMQQLASTFSP